MHWIIHCSAAVSESFLRCENTPICCRSRRLLWFKVALQHQLWGQEDKTTQISWPGRYLGKRLNSVTIRKHSAKKNKNHRYEFLFRGFTVRVRLVSFTSSLSQCVQGVIYTGLCSQYLSIYVNMPLYDNNVHTKKSKCWVRNVNWWRK